MTALVGYHKGVCHVSYRKLQEFFVDVLRLPISTGQLAKLTGKIAAALDAAYEELRYALPSQVQVGVDETGHKENGRQMWTWCLQTPTPAGFMFYAIDSSRGSGVSETLLGADFAGTLSCDFFFAYRKFQQTTNPSVQYCWAHLIRDVQYLTTLSDKVTKNYGERLMARIGKLFHDWHRRDDSTRSAADKQLAKRQAELLAVAKRPPLVRTDLDGACYLPTTTSFAVSIRGAGSRRLLGRPRFTFTHPRKSVNGYNSFRCVVALDDTTSCG